MKFLNLSEAASLSLHTAVVLAGNLEKRLSAKEIAEELKASEFHLAKVMQRLVAAGLVDSRRGPAGGFMLSDSGKAASLLDFFKAVHGTPKTHYCLFDRSVCQGDGCVLGDLVSKVDELVVERLAAIKVSDFLFCQTDEKQALAMERIGVKWKSFVK